MSLGTSAPPLPSGSSTTAPWRARRYRSSDAASPAPSVSGAPMMTRSNAESAFAPPSDAGAAPDRTAIPRLVTLCATTSNRGSVSSARRTNVDAYVGRPSNTNTRQIRSVTWMAISAEAAAPPAACASTRTRARPRRAGTNANGTTARVSAPVTCATSSCRRTPSTLSVSVTSRSPDPGASSTARSVLTESTDTSGAASMLRIRTPADAATGATVNTTAPSGGCQPSGRSAPAIT